MKKKAVALVALAAAGALVLGACGGGRGGDDKTTDSAGGTDKGFAADATIGVALPWLGTQNWVEAQDVFEAQLKAAGFKSIIQAADSKVPTQQQQIESMVEQGAKAIVVAAVDGAQLGSVLSAAKAKGVKIVAYDRLLQNTDAVDAVVQFGSIKTGEIQGQALLDGLAEIKGAGPYNIELFAGGPADPNAKDFFTGAMNILQPEIDKGNLKIVSGQKTFQQVAIQDWDNGKAQTRMDSLYASAGATKIDGVLCPNDGFARAVLTSASLAKKAQPVVDGLDAEDESVKLVWSGAQYETTYKPTDKLVEQTITLIKAWQAGEDPEAATSEIDNGTIKVPGYELVPVAVTKANAKEAFKNDQHRLALLK